MGSRDLYLYEVVDIIGQGQYDYMEHLWRDPVLRMPEMFGLQGSFYVCAAGGGRWPQVVNIWDCGTQGWDGWAANVDRMNLKRRKAFYGDWWDEAAKWRSGGFDRLCGGVPGSPTTEQIQAAGIRGTLFVNEILQVRPGSALDFLDAVAEVRKPLLAEYGHHATGLYEVLSNQHEVVLVWATDLPAQLRYRKARDTTRGLSDDGDADDRIVAWERVSAEFVTGGDTHLMTPLPRTVYGPDDWEDAALEDWLA
ncbi:hypothetical protein I6A84_11865 [Frankia sp. CNm7]|uniref:NIPSNAP family containing protein n=1 Tax=Frankia nepalensis TaxID=1836974 RepID=A0A937RFL8_9ACTN|nr:hypothetical protein [Frankia nepalensis]MBL7501126.1 hypothetical protein [Frankia nepalensis]MBL7515080.1 hypothetical protein [Frankia nepalensis]MBL7518788.1 hypothetical protein [Frankia nepalensis]MBL7631296.1 hypothetical protein [Frankia nepalensis]